MSYQDLITYRDEVVKMADSDHYETNWMWVKEDSGAWDGPKHDWESSHSIKYFKYLKQREVVVTAGACCGMHVRFYAKQFSRVYAFEPDPLNFHCMVNNAQYDNVIKLNAALGDKNGLIRVNRGGMGNVGTHTVSEGGIVPCFALDTLNLDACDLIQLDVEGYELNVVHGAIETIKRFWPVITAENGHKCEDFLTSIGYEGVDQSQSDKVFVKR